MYTVADLGGAPTGPRIFIKNNQYLIRRVVNTGQY